MRIFTRSSRITILLLAGSFYLQLLIPLGSQPVVVPDLDRPDFNSADLDPTLDQANAQNTQNAWETVTNEGVRLLEAGWEADAASQIDLEVLTLGNADFFNNNATYQDYLRSSLNIGQAQDNADWELAAQSLIDAEREPFLAALAEDIRREIEEERTVGIRDYDGQRNPGQQDYDDQRRDWYRNFQSDFENGLQQFSTAIGFLGDRLASFNAELDQTAAVFQQNLQQIRDYENTVRVGIADAVVGLQGFLDGSDLFRQENCTGAICTVDPDTLSTAGLQLQQLINDLTFGLNNDAPLSVLSRQMVDYLEAQELHARNQVNYWNSQSRGDINYARSIVMPNYDWRAPNPYTHDTVANAHDPALLAAAVARGNQYHADYINGWLNDNPDFKAIVDYYETGNRSVLDNYLISYTGSNTNTRRIESLGGADIQAQGPTNTTSNMGGLGLRASARDQRGGGTFFSQIGRNSFYHPKTFRVGYYEWTTYDRVDGRDVPTVHTSREAPSWAYNPDVDLEYEIVFRSYSFATIDRFQHATANARWVDDNAIANAQRWQGYADDLAPVLAHWRDNILPAIEAWEVQAAEYQQSYNDWQVEAALQRQQAQDQYDTALADLVTTRTKWLGRVDDEYRKGKTAWQNRESSVTASVPSSALGEEDNKTVSSIISSFSLPETNSSNLETAADAPDFTLLDGVTDAFQQSALGAKQLALIGSINERAVNRRNAIIEQMAMQAAERGYAVEVLENGTLRGTRQIATGRAIQRAGTSGLNASDYEAELTDQTLHVTGADAFLLTETGSLFEEWNQAEIEKNTKAAFDEYTQRLEIKIDAEQANFDERDAEKERAWQAFLNDRGNKISFKKKKGLFKSFIESVASSMLGGMSLQQATSSFVQDRVTQALAEATGLPTGLLGGMVSGMSFHDAATNFVKTETDRLIAEKAEKDLGIPAGLTSGILSGKSIADAAAAYAEEKAYQELDKKFPGLGQAMRGHKAKKEQAKAKQKQMQDTAVTVAAVAAAPFTGGASMYALAAYKAYDAARDQADKGNSLNAQIQSAVVAGAAGYVTAYTGGAVNVDANWDPEEGFSGGVGFGVGEMGNVGLTYSKEGGLGGTASVEVGEVAKVGVSYNKAEGLGASVSLSGVDNLEGLGLTLKHSEHGGTSGSLGYDDDATGLGGNLSYNPNDGWGVNLTASRKFGKAENNTSSSVSGSIGYSQNGGLTTNVTATWHGTKSDRERDADGDEIPEFNDNFDGMGVGLSWSEQRGLSANVSVGGTNAFNWDDENGWSGNSNYERSYFEKERVQLVKAKQALNRKKAARKLAEAERKKMTEAEQALRERGVSEERIAALAGDPNKLKEFMEDPNNREHAQALDEAGIIALGTSRGEGFGSTIGSMFDNITNSLSGTFGVVSSSSLVQGETGQFRIRTCFVAGTKVWSQEGPKNIEEIQPGDLVWSWKEESNRIELNRVKRTFNLSTQKVYKIVLGNKNEIRTTWSHRFFTADGWKRAEQIKPGEKIHTAQSLGQVTTIPAGLVLTGRPARKFANVQSVSILDEPEVVFNMEVESAHTFFVGESGDWLLVHNENGPNYGQPDPMATNDTIGVLDRIFHDVGVLDPTSGEYTGRIRKEGGYLWGLIGADIIHERRRSDGTLEMVRIESVKGANGKEFNYENSVRRAPDGSLIEGNMIWDGSDGNGRQGWAQGDYFFDENDSPRVFYSSERTTMPDGNIKHDLRGRNGLFTGGFLSTDNDRDDRGEMRRDIYHADPAAGRRVDYNTREYSIFRNDPRAKKDITSGWIMAKYQRHSNGTYAAAEARDRRYELTNGPEGNTRPNEYPNGTFSPVPGEPWQTDHAHAAPTAWERSHGRFRNSCAHRGTCPGGGNPIHVNGHNGTDISWRNGKDLFAMDDGFVTNMSDSLNNIAFTNEDRDGGYNYWHNSGNATWIFPGQQVNGGDYIGRIGGTGGNYPAHLHLTLRDRNGVDVPDSRVLFNRYLGGTQNCQGNYCDTLNPRMRTGPNQSLED